MHFNCLAVWSNSKWICDLSIDSFSPRLWIKCFNYWCSDVRCPLECCMWCRPLSPGKLLPPPRSQPNSTPPSPPAVPPPPLHPADTLMLPPHPAEHALPGMNTLQAASRQATTHWKAFNTQIKSVSLYLPHLPSICCSPPHQSLVCVMPPEHCCGVVQLVSLLNCISAAESLCGNVEYRVL